jgi:4-hydroxy-3-polyprenylbenzoate decarboxylase
MKKYVLAMSGASASAIGIRVLGELVKSSEVHMVISEQTFTILLNETGIDWGGGAEDNEVQEKIRSTIGSENIFYYNERDFAAPVSSGSFRTDGMFVVPCSMKSLSGIANGYTHTLIERAADVTIKEGRPLLLSPREMPFSAIHIENMLKLARLGVKIAPPVLGFYHRPENLEEVMDFIAGKILDAMGVEHELFRRWGS